MEIKICERITVLGLKRRGWESSNTVYREIRGGWPLLTVETRDFYPALAGQATWADSRAGQPVSEYVSLALYVRVEGWC